MPERESLYRSHERLREDEQPEFYLRSGMWKLGNAAWVALPLLSFGYLTWVGFLYAGFRARRTSWLLCSLAYLLGVALVLGQFVTDPANHEFVQVRDIDSYGLVVLALWFGGFVHSLIIFERYLADIAEGDAAAAHDRRVNREYEGRRFKAEPVLSLVDTTTALEEPVVVTATLAMSEDKQSVPA